MKTTKVCYPCLSSLIEHAAELASANGVDEHKISREAMHVLDRKFSLDIVSIEIATAIHESIKQVSGVSDPYLKDKVKEISLARRLFNRVRPLYGNSFDELLKLSIFGNSMDFFKPLDKLTDSDLSNRISFAIDESVKLLEKLKKARRVLYLADNSGEAFFDLPLLRLMRKYASVAYVVKGAPVQNDITLSDIRTAGLESELGEIIDTGMATPGIILSMASEEFLDEFNRADLIFAKGMGHYESISELPESGRYFCCLKAKCQPVADSIGIPLNSYAVILR